MPRKKVVKEEQPQQVIKEVIVEVIKTIEVEKPRLEGFELYARLKEIGYPQGGMGHNMEDPRDVTSVYVPHASEVIAFFNGDPDMWDKMRDGIIRTYIEIYDSEHPDWS